MCGCPMSLRSEICVVALTHVIRSSNVKKMIHFWSGLLLGTKNGLYTTMLNARGHGAEKMNRLKACQKPTFTKKRWCSPFGGMSKESFFFELLPDNTQTSYKFGHSPKTFTAWMGRTATSTIFSRSGTFRLLLFRSLQNFLDGKTFTSNEDVKNHLNQFFASKDQNFYERGIMLLPER